jgi:hypothetical protein
VPALRHLARITELDGHVGDGGAGVGSRGSKRSMYFLFCIYINVRYHVERHDANRGDPARLRTLEARGSVAQDSSRYFFVDDVRE